MNGKVTKAVADFPDGLMFVGPDDSLRTRRKIKSIRLNEALKYAKESQKAGRFPTQEEMQQFIVFED